MNGASRQPITRMLSNSSYITVASSPARAGSFASTQGAALSTYLFAAPTSSQSDASARWVENART